MKTRDPKKLFPNAGVPKVAPKADDRVTEIRRYKLITPLFGGGVEAHKADPITIIRGASVRGQLRFWWRATRGGQFGGDLKKMRQAENAIWGSAAKKGDENSEPSKVQVLIEEWTDGKGDSPFQGSDAHPYVAFPLQPKQEEAKAGMKTLEVKVDVTFALSISYPKDIQEDVQSALWAWETFGGIGGRTRRGFGALQLEEHWVDGEKKSVALPSAAQVSTELRGQLKKFEGKWPEGVPHLEHNLRFEIYPRTSSSGLQAWRNLIDRYRWFRQLGARVDKRTGKPKNQGLSIWPEANALRSRLRKHPKWPEGITPTLVDKFPRAAFGLPILFHLPHDDNETYTLQGDKLDPKSDKSHERLASRLILKPLACANGQYVGLAAVLAGPPEPPTGLQIKEPLPVQKPVEWKLTASEAKSEPINKILHGETDVIEAFLKTLK